MKEKIIKLSVQLGADIIYGLIGAGFLYFLTNSIIPKLLTLKFNGVVVATLNFPQQWYELFSFVNCFVLLFGIRFIVGYITGTYNRFNDKESVKLVEQK